LNRELFPELPTSSAARERPKIGGNQSLKNILGSSSPAVSAWQPGSGGGDWDQIGVNDVGGEGDTEEGGAGKKGKRVKGKQKQTLFTLGSFPA
jgi:hypothetical protein